jgi:hypothetical protein
MRRDGQLTVPDIASLIALNDVRMQDKTVVRVETVLDDWTLDKASVVAADGITIASTRSGTGRWVREKRNHPNWLTQSTWYIDAVGNDENDGATPATPLATHAEFQRRLGAGPIDGFPTVFITSALREDLVVNTDVRTAFGGGIVYQGARTVLYSGSITGLQTWNAAGGLDGQITDAALPVSWTASGLVGKMIVLTSGANAGAVGWVAVDLGAKTCRYSPFWSLATFTPVDPALGDTFEVLDLTEITGSLIVRAKNATVVAFDLRFAPLPGFVDAITSQGGDTFCYFCDAEGPLVFAEENRQLSFVGCRVSTTGTTRAARGALLFYESCLIETETIATGNGEITIFADSLAQATATKPDVSFEVEENGLFTVRVNAFCATFDDVSGGFGLAVTNGGKAVIDGTFWGRSNSPSYAIRVDASSLLTYNPAQPLAYSLGTVNDVLVGSIAAGYGALPIFDITKAAGIVQR